MSEGAPSSEVLQRLVLVRGTGSIGMRHVRVLQRLASTRVLALPVRSERVPVLEAGGVEAVASRAELGGAALFAAIVATDTSRHVPDALDLLPASALLVEKPVAPTLADVQRLAREAQAAGCSIHVAFCLRFQRALLRFRELLPGIGAVHSVHIECRSHLPDWRPERPHRESYSASAAEGGVLRDLAHEIDYALWLFGRPRAVYAQLRNTGVLGIAAEECAELLWTVPDGPSVAVGLDYLTRVPRRRMTASGERGTLTWDGVEQTVVLERPGHSPLVERLAEDRDEMMVRQARAFLSAADRSEAGPLASLEEGAAVAAVSDAARRSSAAHCAAELAPFDW